MAMHKYELCIPTVSQDRKNVTHKLCLIVLELFRTHIMILMVNYSKKFD